MEPGILNLYSIGHSNQAADHFLKLLNEYNIQCLADVRSIPYSRFNPQYNRERLAAFLEEHAIEYIWMGDSLGGKRKEHETQHSSPGKEALYQKGIAELIRIALDERTAMMCSEEDPRNCHRHRVISNTIINRKFDGNNQLAEIHIHHIRAKGGIEAASTILIPVQQKLF